MLNVILQTLWCWAIPIGLILFVSLLPVVVKDLFSKRWKRGPWSLGVFLVLVFVFISSCVMLYAAGIYIYVQPTESLQVVVPTPTPAPPVTPDPKNPFAGVKPIIRTEEIIASMIQFPVLMMFVDPFRPFIPLALVGLAGFTAFLFFSAYVKSKVSIEQRRRKP